MYAFRSASGRKKWLCELRLTLIGLILYVMLCCLMATFVIIELTTIDDDSKSGVGQKLVDYSTRRSQKETIDRFQLDFQCCGVETYTEWHSVNWTSDVRHKQSVPFSCCRTDVLKPCQNYDVNAEGAIESINPLGCTKRFTYHIRLFFICLLMLWLVSLFINLLIIPLHRFIQSSVENSIDKKILPRSHCWAWLYGGHTYIDRFDTKIKWNDVERLNDQLKEEVAEARNKKLKKQKKPANNGIGVKPVQPLYNQQDDTQTNATNASYFEHSA